MSRDHNAVITIQNTYSAILELAENIALDTAASLGPWLAALGPSYFVFKAVKAHFDAAPWAAIAMALGVELVGMFACHTALRAWTWNKARRKTDPVAPFAFTVALAIGYFAIGISLAILLDIFPAVASWSKVVFFGLAGIAYLTLAMSKRLAAWEGEREAEAAEKAAEKADAITTLKAVRVEIEALSAEIDDLAAKKDAIENDIKGLQKERRTAKNAPSGRTSGIVSPLSGASLDHATEVKMSRYQERLSETRRMLAAGLSVDDIAGQLGKSERTIRRYINELNGTVQNAK